MSGLDALYQQVILDHAKLRTGAGPIDGFDLTSFQANPTCGDEVTLGVEVDDAGHIHALAWDGSGCSISQASLSIMSEMVDGQDLDLVRRKFAAMEEMMHSRGKGVDEDVLDELEDAAALEGTSMFANRVKCSLLGWYALRDALAQAGIDLTASGDAAGSEEAESAAAHEQTQTTN